MAAAAPTPLSVCVLGGANSSQDRSAPAAADRFGRRSGGRGHRITCGGRSGLTDLVAWSAHLAGPDTTSALTAVEGVQAAGGARC